MATSGPATDDQCLLQSQTRTQSSITNDHQPARAGITVEALVDAEAVFTSTTVESDHGNVGGDRMSAKHHNYAPIYAKYMTSVLRSEPKPTLAEVGILTGTGLAMWSRLFPESPIFGFDLNTSSYHSNVDHLRSLGFNDKHVQVTQMDQMQSNQQLLQSIFGNLRPHIVIDDGYHIPESGKRTFLSMRPVLAERFVYFIEDVTKKTIDAGEWEAVKSEVLKACPECVFAMECPQTSEKEECVAVIHSRLQL